MLIIKDLEVTCENKKLLCGLNLTMKAGECHAIMGPNGAGKSTLAKVIAGHPAYEVTAGEILFQGQNILEMDPEERAHLGLFMSFQYPIEIAGISNLQFLHASHSAILKAKGQTALNEADFEKFFDEKMHQMHIRPEFKTRSINEGFSGGEKKRNEILQMAILDPVFAVLDETDSGLDIDAMRIVASGINQFRSPAKALLLITHYQRLLDYVKPDFVHVMMDGKIVKSGGFELVEMLEEKGYDWLNTEAHAGHS